MIKSLAKKIIKHERWCFLSWCRSRFGLFSSIFAYIHFLLGGKAVRVTDHVTGVGVFLRPCTADQKVYDEIFKAQEYRLDVGEPVVIVDAGAHIGLSSVYFAQRYPRAMIIAVEPESSNFELLKKNVSVYANIKPVHAGLWSRTTCLAIQDEGVDTWSFRVVEADSEHGIMATSVPDLMSDFNIDRIDVLKIDIEGAELEVLGDSGSWIDSVDTIIIELHDRFRPGCRAALDDALSDFEYSESFSGESIVISNMKRLSVDKNIAS
ncbi:FkbM family methyltransferase [Ectothiorhodospira lacustris]|uniref:FkbM family methyltransferase n=1 Tax=Ectothiorhodospira lacustris TaxID=2899127 RepID=UPI001EE84820|nr:FkbM family methyltransferase [Ectothiorhodospira lacustris]MCG5510344.1 FkbM family methyltransferase [Ectothiorhodospira lacustris]MCG5522090.1 FkbM family methyltransferase [Ectothiorhodospira lacustris]